MTSEKAASLVTLVFNPAVVAAFTFLILLYSQNIASPLLVGISLTFGTFVPLVMMDFYVSEKEQRAKPFAGQY